MQRGEYFVVESNLAGNGIVALKCARELGFRTHFIARDRNIYAPVFGEIQARADQVSIVDTLDINSLLGFFSDKKGIAGISAYTDFHMVQAAILHNFCQCPNPTPLEGVVNCRRKDLTRLLTNPIGSPVQSIRFDLGDFTPINPVGFPCVVKPVDESGSFGVVICEDEKQFQEAVNTIRMHDLNGRGYRMARSFLVEEWIEGPEFSAEMVWDTNKGEWHCFGITEKRLTPPPYAVELGDFFPFEFDRTFHTTVLKRLRDWMKALHFSHASAHVEFKVNGRGIFLMEVNPRVGGDVMNELVCLAIGVDMIANSVRLHAGIPLDLEPKLKRCAAMYQITSSRLGTIFSVHPPVEKPKGFIRECLPQKGCSVGSLQSNDGRLGYVVFEGETLGEVSTISSYYAKSIELVYE